MHLVSRSPHRRAAANVRCPRARLVTTQVAETPVSLRRAHPAQLAARLIPSLHHPVQAARHPRGQADDQVRGLSQALSLGSRRGSTPSRDALRRAWRQRRRTRNSLCRAAAQRKSRHAVHKS